MTDIRVLASARKSALTGSQTDDAVAQRDGRVPPRETTQAKSERNASCSAGSPEIRCRSRSRHACRNAIEIFFKAVLPVVGVRRTGRWRLATGIPGRRSAAAPCGWVTKFRKPVTTLAMPNHRCAALANTPSVSATAGPKAGFCRACSCANRSRAVETPCRRGRKCDSRSGPIPGSPGRARSWSAHKRVKSCGEDAARSPSVKPIPEEPLDPLVGG